LFRVSIVEAAAPAGRFDRAASPAGQAQVPHKVWQQLQVAERLLTPALRSPRKAGYRNRVYHARHALALLMNAHCYGPSNAQPRARTARLAQAC
jgi:hypothetical protein